MTIEGLRGAVAEYDAVVAELVALRKERDELIGTNGAQVRTIVGLQGRIADLEKQLSSPGNVVKGPWAPLFEENFETDVVEGGFLGVYGNRWTAYTKGWKDTSKKGSYNPDILRVEKGILRMRLHTLNGVPQVACPVPRINPDGSTSQLYGRYEIRFRADAIDGYKFVTLLWPKSEVWPRDGEINIVEGDLNGTINAYMHRQNGVNGADQDAYTTRKRFTAWHTAVLEWTPESVSFFLDGELIGKSTKRIPNTPMRFGLQAETDLSDEKPPASATGFVEVDYVKVWKFVEAKTQAA
jgi:hypothetical protein